MFLVRPCSWVQQKDAGCNSGKSHPAKARRANLQAFVHPVTPLGNDQTGKTAHKQTTEIQVLANDHPSTARFCLTTPTHLIHDFPYNGSDGFPERNGSRLQRM